MTNDEIRKQIIRQRKQLSAEYKNTIEESIFNELLSMEEYRTAENLLLYIDYNGEVQTRLILKYALNSNKNVYVPLCKDNCIMDFYKIADMSQLKEGHYGILEPEEDNSNCFNATDLCRETICIVPGVAFDRDNNRIGYGKGYYDRFFERFNIPNRIGLAYDFQIVEKLNISANDIRMTKILTVTENNK